MSVTGSIDYSNVESIDCRESEKGKEMFKWEKVEDRVYVFEAQIEYTPPHARLPKVHNLKMQIDGSLGDYCVSRFSEILYCWEMLTEDSIFKSLGDAEQFAAFWRAEVIRQGTLCPVELSRPRWL